MTSYEWLICYDTAVSKEDAQGRLGGCRAVAPPLTYALVLEGKMTEDIHTHKTHT